MIIWTDYLKHRAQLRGFDLATIEQVVQFSEERYFDIVTQRMVVVGRHKNRLVLMAYDPYTSPHRVRVPLPVSPSPVPQPSAAGIISVLRLYP